MDLFGKLCSSDQPTIMHGKNFNTGHYTQTFQPMFFIPAIHIGTIDFYHFISTFTDLGHCCRSQGQCKAKPLGFIFSHTFQLIRRKFDILLKQFKLKILMLFMSEI